jgi:hypothetical protein
VVIGGVEATSFAVRRIRGRAGVLKWRNYCTDVNSEVNMRLSLVRRGSRFDIYALAEGEEGHGGSEDCPAQACIASASRAIKLSLTNLLLRHADHGPIYNEQKSRELMDGIFEFKTTQGARILYFYDRTGRTILTHGFDKCSDRRLTREIDRALLLIARWREEVGNE